MAAAATVLPAVVAVNADAVVEVVAVGRGGANLVLPAMPAGLAELPNLDLVLNLADALLTLRSAS